MSKTYYEEMSEERVSEAVIRRMPKYYRYLTELELAGEVRISSSKMSRDLGLNASQIRRDLNCFGGFGQQGYGYSVEKLRREIARILGLDKQYNAVIVGAGNMGTALLRYSNFDQMGFHMIGIFDIEKTGTTVGGKKVLPMEQLGAFVRERQVSIGIICTPRSAAQQTADALAGAGVRAIWNFAPADVHAREGVAVENVRLNDSLYVLCYSMNAEGDGAE